MNTGMPGRIVAAFVVLVSHAVLVVPATAMSWDPAALDIPWAADLNAIAANEIDVQTDGRLKNKAQGDGVTDDTSAVRAAIALAASLGGGTIYFPRGSYKIITPSHPVQGSPLVVPSQVILRGAGPKASTLLVIDTQAASQTDWIGTWGGISFTGSSLSGMTDLGVFAINPSTSPCAVLWNRGSGNTRKLFFNNLDLHLENCKNVWFESTHYLSIQNSTIDSKATLWGPIYAPGNSNVVLRNNTITYKAGRIQLQGSNTVVVQDNSIVRDAEQRSWQDGTAIESGGIEISFCANIQILNNVLQTLNAPAHAFHDGEAITSQQSTTPTILDAGSVTELTSTTITDSGALWGASTRSRLAQYPTVVAMLTGAATGEWRRVTSINTATKTMTIDRPWSRMPELGNLYSMFVWTLMYANIQDNRLIDNPNGIVLFDGCYACTVQNNVLTNSRGIMLRVGDVATSPLAFPDSRRQHHVALDSAIVSNRITNTTGQRPAYIVLDVEAFEANSYRGMGMFGIEVAGNILEPYALDLARRYDHPEINQEGLFLCFVFGPAQVKDPPNVIFRNISEGNNRQTLPVAYRADFVQYTNRSCAQPLSPGQVSGVHIK